jgi:endonuclease YncB( thermonuclease family)
VTVKATTWRLLHPRAIDGDSLRGYLTRDEWLAAGFAHTIFSAEQTEDGIPVADTQLLRLVVVDTPERGEPGYVQGRLDVRDWLAAHPGPLCVDTYESAGWDRLLADVYPEGDRGDTLTQWLLQLGWPVYGYRSRDS